MHMNACCCHGFHPWPTEQVKWKAMRDAWTLGPYNSQKATSVPSMTTRNRHFRFPQRPCPWAWNENCCWSVHLHCFLSPFQPLFHPGQPDDAQPARLFPLLDRCGPHAQAPASTPVERRMPSSRDWLWPSANVSLKPNGREGKGAEEWVSTMRASEMCSSRLRRSLPVTLKLTRLLPRRATWTSPEPLVAQQCAEQRSTHQSGGRSGMDRVVLTDNSWTNSIKEKSLP